MEAFLDTYSPVDGSIYVERHFATDERVNGALARAVSAHGTWRDVAVAERAALCCRAIDAFVAARDGIASEISWQMGRPIRFAPVEVAGFEERARHMIDIAPDSLADIEAEPRPGFSRFVQRRPLGVVFVIAPWNYPYLTAVNSIVPALMAGNVVILKHSAQTPLCAERLYDAFSEAGLPDGVFQYLHLDHDQTARLIAAPEVDFIAFTGSVAGGAMVEHAAAGRFIGTGLELGGKDPAYVRADADLGHAIENVVDGAFFNSGQSCCGIERVYVAAPVFDAFVDGCVETVGAYCLGDPTDPETTLGPMVRTSAADHVRRQVTDAVAAGARPLIDENAFAAARIDTPYLAPQVLVDVDHSMEVMREETFGPVVGIMRVAGDDEAVHLMNDSPYGLTASVWTSDIEAARRIGERVDTGTWFMNRCDYLDPALAWTGVKNSGRGCTLSAVGYEHLTRPKSFHLRTSL